MAEAADQKRENRGSPSESTDPRRGAIARPAVAADQLLNTVTERRMVAMDTRVEHCNVDVSPLRRLPHAGDIELLQAPRQTVIDFLLRCRGII